MITVVVVLRGEIKNLSISIQPEMKAQCSGPSVHWEALTPCSRVLGQQATRGTEVLCL